MTDLSPNTSLRATAEADTTEEVDENIIRTIFLKNKKNELFVQQSPELLIATENYQGIFAPKDARRRSRLVARLAKAGRNLSSLTAEELREFGKKGFPEEYRSKAYEVLLNIESFEVRYGKDYFSKCLKTDIPSSVGRVIQVDIPRTLNAFVSTCGEVTRATLMKMLRDVLWAFAVHKPEVGYCQSMNFIAAYFLSIFGSAKKSFYALVQFIDSPTSPYVGLHIAGYYAPGMAQLLTEIGVLEEMCRSRLGEKSYRNFFERREISHLSLIVSEWFLTCYVTIFPLRTTQRVMDFLISNGGGSSKVLFRIAYVLLTELVKRPHELADLDQVMQGHKRITKNWVDHNRLIVGATRGIKMFSRSDIERWRKKVLYRMNGTGSGGSSLAHPTGTTMMKLEEAIAPQTTTTLTVQEDAVFVEPEGINK